MVYRRWREWTFARKGKGERVKEKGSGERQDEKKKRWGRESEEMENWRL